MRTSDHATDVETGFYVSVIDGTKRGLLHGPHGTEREARELLADVKAAALAVDPFAGFYAYGTARVVAPTLPTGKLNYYMAAHAAQEDTL